MNTITFGRYVPTLTTVSIKGVVKNVFMSVIDHTDDINDDGFSWDRSIVSTHRWLKDHFGFVIITDSYGRTLRLCNYKKTVHTLDTMGVKMKLKNHIK